MRNDGMADSRSIWLPEIQIWINSDLDSLYKIKTEQNDYDKGKLRPNHSAQSYCYGSDIQDLDLAIEFMRLRVFSLQSERRSYGPEAIVMKSYI